MTEKHGIGEELRPLECDRTEGGFPFCGLGGADGLAETLAACQLTLLSHNDACAPCKAGRSNSVPRS
ncbi:hypothetical protein SAMN04488503_3224 [Humidesulfovibrio mexicanus]|uniref:Uncharacterized protein n=1 Tax=Humidesulfovibrio mexicanus TaxID=147047 RepID=A0A239CMP8_9BACT|nr:hypothetical protein [Humidesulfovibrio mexicanus]SNS21526.1 hypothetical protein SAMN04488503_3224 [Humidesulfovibrio mexicanus]